MYHRLPHQIEVAKVILQAITSKNPQLRYIVGTSIIQARMNMSDKEFQKMIMQRLFNVYQLSYIL